LYETNPVSGSVVICHIEFTGIDKWASSAYHKPKSFLQVIKEKQDVKK